MAKKLVVPQSGTTPAPSPLDNMLHTSAAHIDAPVVVTAPKVSNKKRTSILMRISIRTSRFTVRRTVKAYLVLSSRP